MGEPLILEVADHRGRVRLRTRLVPAEPETIIGRAPRNDVVLDDPYVDPRHLRIVATDDNGWRFTDLGSVNGVWLGHSGIRQFDGVITPGLELKIGRSMLRFVSPDAPVAPALLDPTHRGGIAHRLLEPRILVAILALALASSATTRYYGSTRAVTIADLVTPGLTVLIFTALWAAAWAFTNRLVAHRFRFVSHLAWAILITTVGSALATGGEWLGFFLPNTNWSGLEILAWWFGGALLLVGHFELVTEWPRTRRWIVAAAATGMVAAVVVVLARSEALKEGALTHETGALKPVDVRYLPSTSLDAFVRDAGELKTKVDETAAEAEPDQRDAGRPSGVAVRIHRLPPPHIFAHPVEPQTSLPPQF